MLFWIFSFAEPSSTIMAASLPILRVLFRPSGHEYSSQTPGGYLKSTNSKFHTFKTDQRTATDPVDLIHPDNSSDRSILGHSQGLSYPAHGGIARTMEVTVQYDSGQTSTSSVTVGHGEAYEMQTRKIERKKSVIMTPISEKSVA